MDLEARLFPPRPIRGVQGVYARLHCGPCSFAWALMDFEPRQEGVTFEVAAPLETRGDPGAQELSAYCRALEAGVREKLAGQRAGTSAAVAVVLRGIRVHPTDSHPRAFHMAGCLAAGKALLVAYGPPPRSQRRRAPAGDTRRCYLGCLGPGARGRASCVLRLAGLCP